MRRNPTLFHENPDIRQNGNKIRGNPKVQESCLKEKAHSISGTEGTREYGEFTLVGSRVLG